jgi:hypothetical protein
VAEAAQKRAPPLPHRALCREQEIREGLACTTVAAVLLAVSSTPVAVPFTLLKNLPNPFF